MKWFRKLWWRDTDRLRNEAAREHLHRACRENQDASSVLIQQSRKTRPVSKAVMKAVE